MKFTDNPDGSVSCEWEENELVEFEAELAILNDRLQQQQDLHCPSAMLARNEVFDKPDPYRTRHSSEPYRVGDAVMNWYNFITYADCCPLCGSDWKQPCEEECILQQKQIAENYIATGKFPVEYEA